MLANVGLKGLTRNKVLFVSPEDFMVTEGRPVSSAISGGFMSLCNVTRRKEEYETRRRIRNLRHFENRFFEDCMRPH